jgi:polysaccharide pyruvyl transferase WcaK-like protein
MNRPGFNRIKKRWVLHTLIRMRSGEPIFVENNFLNSLSFSRIIVSPRFHGVCLGFMLQKPVIAIASNTYKIEGLYRDIGLDSNLVLKPNQVYKLANKMVIARMVNQVLDERKKIQRFQEEARRRISNMFEQIRRV